MRDVRDVRLRDVRDVRPRDLRDVRLCDRLCDLRDVRRTVALRVCFASFLEVRLRARRCSTVHGRLPV